MTKFDFMALNMPMFICLGYLQEVGGSRLKALCLFSIKQYKFSLDMKEK